MEAQDPLCIFGRNILKRNHAGNRSGKFAIRSGGKKAIKREPFPSDRVQHSQSAAICPFVCTRELMSHRTSLLAVRNSLALYCRSKPHTCVGHTEDKKQPALKGNRSN